jgi:hypothetical protein
MLVEKYPIEQTTNVRLEMRLEISSGRTMYQESLFETCIENTDHDISLERVAERMIIFHAGRSVHTFGHRTEPWRSW